MKKPIHDLYNAYGCEHVTLRLHGAKKREKGGEMPHTALPLAA